MEVHSSFLWCEAQVWWCLVYTVCLIWTNRHDHNSQLLLDLYSEVPHRCLSCYTFNFIPSFTVFYSLLIICRHIFPAVIVIVVEFTAPTVILLQIICARRAGEFFLASHDPNSVQRRTDPRLSQVVFLFPILSPMEFGFWTERLYNYITESMTNCLKLENWLFSIVLLHTFVLFDTVNLLWHNLYCIKRYINKDDLTIWLFPMICNSLQSWKLSKHSKSLIRRTVLLYSIVSLSLHWGVRTPTDCRWRFSTAWYGTVRHGSVRYGTAQFGLVCVSTAV